MSQDKQSEPEEIGLIANDAETNVQIHIARRTLMGHAKEIGQIVEQARSALKDRSQIPLFRAMYTNLKGVYDEFNTKWRSLEEIYLRSNRAREFPSTTDTNIQNNIRRYYYEIISIYMELFPSEHSQAGPSGHNQSTFTESRIIRAQLPQISLPKFSGIHLSDWPRFRDIFRALVLDDGSISPIEKFHFLITSLSGEALSLVSKFQLTGNNFDQAWKALTDFYENKRVLATCYLDAILRHKPAQGKPTLATLQSFMTNVVDNANSFNLLNLNNPTEFLLCYLALRGLDPITRQHFELTVPPGEFPKFDTLVNFVRQRCHAMKMSTDSPVSDLASFKPSYSGKSNRSQALFAQNDSKQKSNYRSTTTHKDFQIQCFVCKNSHTISSCPKFLSSTVDERHSYLKDFKGCKNCLNNKHTTGSCKSKYTCRVCKQRHHTHLHIYKDVALKAPTPEEPKEESTSAVPAATLNSTDKSTSNVILGTAVAYVKNAKGFNTPIRLVIDSGSHFSFITQNCVMRLGLKSRHFRKRISGLGQNLLSDIKGIVDCILTSKDEGMDFSTKAVIVPNITHFLPTSTLPTNLVNEFSNFDLADETFWKPGPIDFLLGADLFPQVITGPPVTFQKSNAHPYLFPTIFGHVIIGQYESAKPDDQASHLFFLQDADNLSHQLSRFWEIEEPHSKGSFKDPEDEACESHFKDTHYRTTSGRYTVSLPFKPTFTSLGDSKSVALKRFLHLERKLASDQELRIAYHTFMREYLELGHMQVAKRHAKYIIPHHGIWQHSSRGKKLRVVFDASSKTSLGSLNDNLLKGPKLQKDICDILLNFRIYPFVFTADIIKMYRQIRMHDPDTDYQHILWRFDPSDSIQEMELLTVTYGLTSSPYQAIRTILQLKEDEGANFPLAVKALDSMFVDDLATGEYTLEGAKECQRQIVALLSLGGFELGKWSSNHPGLLETVIDTTFDPLELSTKEHDFVKVLGLQWDPTSDVLFYRIENKLPCTHTKRSVLSTIARIYDPLGYLAPTIFCAKCILQSLWKADPKLDWDDPLVGMFHERWVRFCSNLKCLSAIKIPRYFNIIPDITCSLIGFCDASELGYAAVLYLHAHHPDKTYVSIFKAKTKLAPIKSPLTIPKMELCGALLLARLYNSIKPACQKLSVSEVKFFTDSKIVLQWIKIPTHRLKTFVANRIVEILDLTQGCTWHHVRSENNPADCASRGLDPENLPDHPLWWRGHLQVPDDTIYDEVPLESVPELKPSVVSLISLEQPKFAVEWMSRFSSWTCLINTIVRLRRFIIKHKPKPPDAQSNITINEIYSATLKCVRVVQEFYFGKTTASTLPKLLAPLVPFVDQHGVLRVGGRLANTSLPDQFKHPIIMPNKCKITELLIKHYHLLYHHAGPNLLHAFLRQRYWIISARKMIRSIVTHCAHCFRFYAKPIVPQMGSLPSSRFHESRAFRHVGVDYAGPFVIRDSLRRKSSTSKSYLCLFVCLATKALHLELVSSLTTEAFIATLERFVSRRGLPECIYSDCGTNFVGAERYLKDVYGLLNSKTTQNEISKKFVSREVRWSFIPPHSPHFGGLWEAGVKSVKSILRHVLGTTPFTFEELTTIFCQIEAILNSRPLCPLTEAPDDFDALTPGHFLVGDALTALPQPTLLELKENRLSRWQLVTARLQHCWKRWRLQYLHTLQARSKWHRKDRNIQIGELVLIKEDHASPGEWALARVTETHPGKDGITRVLTLKTSKGSLLKRPAIKVIPFPSMKAEIISDSS